MGAADPVTVAPFAPGDLLFFERGTVYALPELLEEPITFLSIDTSRRHLTDIVLVDAGDSMPVTFMTRSTDSWSMG